MSSTNGHSESCGTCRYWTRVKPGQPVGLCRQKPPTLVLLGLAPPPIAGQNPLPITDTFWPQLPDKEWCGAWTLGKKHYAEIDLSTIDGNAA